MYYNTTQESGQLLIDYTARTRKQDDLVLRAFRILGKPLTPSECWAFLVGSKDIDDNTPITSIRRSITNLTGEMKLRKTEEKGKGRYGRNEFKWSLNN